jgi:hypothetical protein
VRLGWKLGGIGEEWRGNWVLGMERSPEEAAAAAWRRRTEERGDLTRLKKFIVGFGYCLCDQDRRGKEMDARSSSEKNGGGIWFVALESWCLKSYIFTPLLIPPLLICDNLFCLFKRNYGRGTNRIGSEEIVSLLLGQQDRRAPLL